MYFVISIWPEHPSIGFKRNSKALMKNKPIEVPREQISLIAIFLHQLGIKRKGKRKKKPRSVLNKTEMQLIFFKISLIMHFWFLQEDV